MGLTLITPPAVEPVSLAEMKKHLGVDHSDDDDYIGMLIAAARSTIDGREGWLGRTLITQTWDYILDTFPSAEIYLPLLPVQQVENVAYVDSNGDTQSVAAGDYMLDTASYQHWLFPMSGFAWPATLGGINNVTIRLKAGYGDNGANVPAPIRAAIMLMTAEMYERREAQQGQGIEENPTVMRLLHPYRVYWI